MSLTNEQIVEAVAGKTLMEVMELVKAIEDKFGVTAAAPMMAMPMAVNVMPLRFLTRRAKGSPTRTMTKLPKG